ncbi:MAG: glycerol-3-phosphate dehydrogenase C-terminal domain-containing protein [Actinomycetota bacterium]|nr:glycerol-3-phosphate dehydrogenase C-terminal domain-containing protein [Actinomycetota bacterium]
MKFDDDVLAKLLKQGTFAFDILEMVNADESLAERLAPDIPYIKAQVKYAAENEMARSIEDFLVRRSEIYYTSTDQGLSVAEEVARIMSGILGWDEAEINRQIENYKDRVNLSRRYLD